MHSHSSSKQFNQTFSWNSENFQDWFLQSMNLIEKTKYFFVKTFITQTIDSKEIKQSTIRERDLAEQEIELKYFAENLELNKLLEIAENTKERKIALTATGYIAELAEQEQELATSYLIRLAQGNSLACLAGLINLFNLRAVSTGESILYERLTKGDFFQMLKLGHAKGLAFLDILGAVDDYRESNLCYENFPLVWKSLESRKEEQYNLLSEILGDINPGAKRMAVDQNLIPQSVKIQTLQILNTIRPPNYERAMWYATRSEDDFIAYQSTMFLTEYWQSQDGFLPPGLEPFPMLNVNLLFFLCRKISDFHWRDNSPAGELCKQYNSAKDELEELDPESNHFLYFETKERTDKLRRKLFELCERRLNSLQPIVDTITNSLNLPHAKIISTDTKDVTASYRVGTGTVAFSRIVLTDDKPLTEEFTSSLLHELTHMEQDVLLIRLIADDIDLKYGQHSQDLELLFNKYSSAVGYVPDSIFLLEVLRLRADQKLNPEERARAEQLLRASYDDFRLRKEGKEIEERESKVQKVLTQLFEPNFEFFILDLIKDEKTLAALFMNKNLFFLLKEKISFCLTESNDRILSLGLSKKAQKYQFSTTIKLLFELLSSSYSQYFSPIFEDLRKSFFHILEAEIENLEDRLSEIRRAGYHESEAYVVSDRVEVLVKALHKGWYQFTD